MRCEATPQADQSISLRVDGVERAAWRFPDHAPRPFVFPLLGPAGAELTRLGHPGAPNHDHHRSVWFAHHRVLGMDFWSDAGPMRIRQQSWLAMQDGPLDARLAVRLNWLDGHDPAPLLQQDLVLSLAPCGPREQESLLEIQTSLRPAAEQLELGRTNYGLLAVRVARGLSEHFGEGLLADSEGRRGEAEIFERTAAWVDYSGTARTAAGGLVPAGVTYFDHPANPDHPPQWHVRSDGWMGASLTGKRSLPLRRDAPLTLRYLLHLHGGPADRGRSDEVFRRFAESPAWEIRKSSQPHLENEIARRA